MSKSKITKTIDYLSDPKKGITAAVLLVLLVILAVFAWKKIKKVWSDVNKPTLLTDSGIVSGTGTDITSSIDFKALVLRLWEACLGIGTNEAEVYAVMECLNTQADYMKLSNDWIRQWNSMGMLAQMALPSTLPATLQSELSSSELAKVRSILTAKGITPDF